MIDAAWLIAEPRDMRAGVDATLARVVNVFGAARSHQAFQVAEV
jgi:transposase